MPDSDPREPTLAQLIDPVALEARLAEARERRARALARHSAGGRRWPGARLAATLRAGGRLPIFFAGLVAGAALAAVPAVLRAPAPPVALTDIAAAAPPAAGATPPALAGAAAGVAAAPPGPLAPLAAAALRPEPRPAGFAPPPQPGPVTRSARNRPQAAPPPTAARVVHGLNAATLGRAAAALGLRERVALPGVTLSLDRRGLRLQAQGRKSKRQHRNR